MSRHRRLVWLVSDEEFDFSRPGVDRLVWLCPGVCASDEPKMTVCEVSLARLEKIFISCDRGAVRDNALLIVIETVKDSVRDSILGPGSSSSVSPGQPDDVKPRTRRRGRAELDRVSECLI